MHLIPTENGVINAFFQAMKEGWSEDARQGSVEGLPGMKAIQFQLGDYRVVDAYYTTPHSDKSTGMTMIWYDAAPVWVMHYGGQYPKVAIPFLKQCLHRAYVEERRFYGGRGPYFVRDDRFTYVNKIKRSAFANFEGEEYIFDLNEQELGHHWYRGMSLLKSA